MPDSVSAADDPMASHWLRRYDIYKNMALPIIHETKRNMRTPPIEVAGSASRQRRAIHLPRLGGRRLRGLISTPDYARA